jgi:dGTPase
VAEEPPRFRNAFQRDRDRVVHCSAFRRLEYKTQVFVNHEGDLFRTRLTHSLEVAQIARSISRALGLDEDLAEAIALAHDLGHTPFGHAGQDALNECMAPHGGFEHNLQSLRVVDVLEERYADFDGLNLTYETKEGILKHCAAERAAELGELGERFLRGGQPSLEAQVVNLADGIAYNNHDVDDGLRAELLDSRALEELDLFGRCSTAVRTRHPHLQGRRLVHEVVRTMINLLVCDLIEHTDQRLAEAAPRDIDAVRACLHPLVGFSAQVEAWQRELATYLHANLYRHYRVMRMAHKAKRVIRELFHTYMSTPDVIPDVVQRRMAIKGLSEARAIADYIAGMTDRYAILEHQRLLDPAIPG